MSLWKIHQNFFSTRIFLKKFQKKNYAPNGIHVNPYAENFSQKQASIAHTSFVLFDRILTEFDENFYKNKFFETILAKITSKWAE